MMNSEREWLSCPDPWMLLEWLCGQALVSERKLRLFSVGCCHRISKYITGDASLRVIELAERRFESDIAAYKLDAAHSKALQQAHKLAQQVGGAVAEAAYAAAYTGCLFAKDSVRAFQFAAVALALAESPENLNEGIQCEEQAQARLLRCIFGNPFRPLPPVSASLLTPSVLALAEMAYAERLMPEGTLDPEKLQALADAMREAGCQDEVLLGHLREPDATHVRGCWVVDLLLGNR